MASQVIEFSPDEAAIFEIHQYLARHALAEHAHRLYVLMMLEMGFVPSGVAKILGLESFAKPQEEHAGS